ncbi:STAS domain-containing protein [Streptomyces sp. CB01881]|uniref:STAS domain-containing protein n=1 Tax=Streptomyces sp. CB01881 TaxID=2078691 RepID=UPI0011E069BA|nr:STAS domain-containing protein [Streptomyces sp. CB01881]TYC76384.1 anti-sigma factor antagonist [Streptomyces sp. CB01881]
MSRWESSTRRRRTSRGTAPPPPGQHCSPDVIAAGNKSVGVRLAGTSQHPVAAVCGEIDQDCAAGLGRALIHALDASPGVLTIDMTGVSFTDSTGLNILLRVRARQTGKTLSLRPGRFLSRILDLTETTTLFAIEPAPDRRGDAPT